jgi:hypothetical protein
MSLEFSHRPLISKAARSALHRLSRDGMLLRPDPRGGYCVSAVKDLRRWPAARVSAAEAKALASEGLVEGAGLECWRIAAAGRAYLAREIAVAAPAAIEDSNGEMLAPQSAVMRRLRALTADGCAWFSALELQAAQALERDYRMAQMAQRVTADWSAPPMDRTRRHAPDGIGGPDCAMDARTRLVKVQAALGAQCEALLRDVLNDEISFEEVERRRNWPPRSAKVALKMALSMLADLRRDGRAA